MVIIISFMFYRYVFISDKISTHINILNIIAYFFHVTFSFSINLDAKIVITIELVLITEITETFPSNNANYSKSKKYVNYVKQII